VTRRTLPNAAIAVLAVVLGCAFAGQAGAASDDQALLDAHRPVLLYDSHETFFAQPVDEQTRVRKGDRIYGHVVREGRQIWLQYWFFYADNPQDRGIFKTGRHEGDWEFAQVRLGPRGAPEALTVAEHSWAQSCGWSRVDSVAGAPRLWVANGSHALYPRAGGSDRPWPDPNDEADGNGRRVRPKVSIVTDSSPSWIRRTQPWGNSRAGFVPGEHSSPRGPMFQPGNRWRDPAGFDQSARACGSGAPGRLWQDVLTALIVFAGAALLVLLAFRVVRRRRAPADSKP
jgi:hypothetical protein